MFDGVFIKGKGKFINGRLVYTADELKQHRLEVQREQKEILLKETWQRAKEYYFPNFRHHMSEEDMKLLMEKVVFADWLNKHIEKNFEPMTWVGP